MKAKTKIGNEILFGNKWNKIIDCMIINFMKKNTYNSFKQTKNHLLIDTSDGLVDIVFSGEIPILLFDHYDKDQLVLKVK